MALLTNPKPIVIRIKDATGARKEIRIEDVVYLEVLDYSKQETNKCVFLINLNG